MSSSMERPSVSSASSSTPSSRLREAERTNFYNMVNRATPLLPAPNPPSRDDFTFEFPPEMIPPGMTPNFKTVWDVLGHIFSDVVTKDSIVAEFTKSEGGLLDGDAAFDKVATTSLLITRPAPSADPDSPVPDPTPPPTLQKAPPTWQPFFDPPLPGMYETQGHTEASREVADRLYPHLPPCDVGGDPICGDHTGMDSCPIASCYQRIQMHIDSVRKHVETHHNKVEVFCNCGRWIKGADIVWHISAFHFCDEHIQCRSCKAVRKKWDFALHLTMCPALDEHRVNQDVPLALKDIEIDRTRVTIGVKRSMEESTTNTTPRKKRRTVGSTPTSKKSSTPRKTKPKETTPKKAGTPKKTPSTPTRRSPRSKKPTA
ncbi:hypothetical protein BT96DRAFT_406083 [Gymnopus androsaceus JB14]|uniref:Uncharacterized protein n=1 Tax=Gymnopus androsaceus JB14 TaxID=1447944 RepID=A0A6A4HZD7_9AGAR|nr:hypothetical protein BT96DRAFT_406083 [Gymnopus androsaceus JB14]